MEWFSSSIVVKIYVIQIVKFVKIILIAKFVKMGISYLLIKHALHNPVVITAVFVSHRANVQSALLVIF